MARLSRLFSRKDAGTPAAEQASAKQRRRVAEVTAAPASSPLPPAPQPDVSVTPPRHGAANDGQQGNGAPPEPVVAAGDTHEPARRHHRADLRTPQQADPALRVRRTVLPFLSVDATICDDAHGKLHVFTKQVSRGRSYCCACVILWFFRRLWVRVLNADWLAQQAHPDRKAAAANLAAASRLELCVDVENDWSITLEFLHLVSSEPKQRIPVT